MNPKLFIRSTVQEELNVREACIVGSVSPTNTRKHLINRLLMEDDEIKNSDFCMTFHSFRKLTNIVLIANVDRESDASVSS